MKRKVLTFGLFFTMCLIGRLDAVTFDYSSELDAHDDTDILHEPIIISGAGTYSLAKLKTIAANDSSILINTYQPSGPIGAVILSVDGSFVANNTFDVHVDANNFPGTAVLFEDSFLNQIDGENDYLLRFNELQFSFAEPYFGGVSSDYVYEWWNCGSDKCVRRRYSQEYLAAHQAGAGLTGIASIVQYTPAVLLRPVSVINQHELFGTYNFSDDYFISVVPEYYNARDFNDMGLRLNIGTKVAGRLFVGAAAYLSTANFKYGVDDFDYAIYGGNLRFLYGLDDVLFLRGVGGLSVANIKSEVAQNPNVFSSYVGADFGAKFDFESGLYLSPFVGFGMTNADVLGVRDNDYLAHVGTDVGFKYFMDGVSYSYNLRTGINFMGYVDAAINIDAWTVADKIGGGVSVGVVDTEFGWTGKFSANARFAF